MNWKCFPLTQFSCGRMGMAKKRCKYGTCDGSGIRPYVNQDKRKLGPEDWVSVERCDGCNKFANDLQAAIRWGGRFAHFPHPKSNYAGAVCLKPLPKGLPLRFYYPGTEKSGGADRFTP